MFILNSYSIAVIFCLITMICWGSWANTQKLATKKWPFPLYYWDYALGIVIITFVLGVTMGSSGSQGRAFFPDLLQANWDSFKFALLGGVIFNLANILLVAAIDIAGMAVAFPVAIGLALVIGVIVNYLNRPIGDPKLLFIGVACIVIAIILDAIAYKRAAQNSKKLIAKGLIIALISGILMSFFYLFVAKSMATNFAHPTKGYLTPYSASFIFALGIFLSSFIINTWMMKWPLVGEKLNFKDYFSQGSVSLHSIGILGGIIWGLGSLFNFIASGVAGTAISYGLGQGATMIAALWGVFIWKEFAKAPKGTNKLIVFMFLFYLIGLGLIISARSI